MATKKLFSHLAGMVVVSVLLSFLAGCQSTPPPNSGSAGFTNGFGRAAFVGVVVNPVGPPRWTYEVQSFTFEKTNAPAFWNNNRPYPGRPNGHGTGIGFTNFTVSVANCVLTNLPTGWSVSGGSCSTTNPSGSPHFQFSLDCDKTNGVITITLTDIKGRTVTVGALPGPQ